jgi:hypothetical protein
MTNSVSQTHLNPRPAALSAGTPTPSALHFPLIHAQTPQTMSAPARARPAPAVRRNRLADPHPARIPRVALLPHGNQTSSDAPSSSVSGGASEPRDAAASTDPGAPINALASLLRAKRRRGYQDWAG